MMITSPEGFDNAVQEVLTDPQATENAITLLEWVKDNAASVGFLTVLVVYLGITGFFKYYIGPRFGKKD